MKSSSGFVAKQLGATVEQPSPGVLEVLVLLERCWAASTA